MWIPRHLYDELVTSIKENREAVLKNIELERHNAFLQTTIDWMKVRLNQVELLNAALIEKKEAVTPVVPQIGRPARSIEDLLGENADLFTDPEEVGVKAPTSGGYDE